jgi:hypothetical protein
MEEVKDKKPRTEKQKAATAKALEALKARRQIAREVIDDEMRKEVEEAEERIVSKIMTRIKEQQPKEAPAPVIPKAGKKKVTVEEDDSSSEEEVVVVRKQPKAKHNPEPVIPSKPKATTGNKLLDRIYGLV